MAKNIPPAPQSSLPTPSGRIGGPNVSSAPLASYPPAEQWDDWVEYDPKSWPRKVPKHYMLVPTICFNCEAGCGLLAYVDKQSLEIRKLEGNPKHPGSRGRNCAKGPATLNQIYDSERILYPLRRAGERGQGKWERVTWEEVLSRIASELRETLQAGRGHEIMYHVGRPGHDGYMDRVLQSWGIDGHNSHTNVCSAGARTGYNLWQGFDRPSPDHANAKFILLLSAHLEAGHYFNPHAQRIIEAKMRGAKVAVIDTRLSNTASMGDYWLSTWPGTEAAVLFSLAHLILSEGLFDREFLRRWTNWEMYMAACGAESEPTFDNFVLELKKLYSQFTPEYAARESGLDAGTLETIAREIGRAGSAFSSHVWRNAASGNLGGWQVARALQLLHVLTGSVGTLGGVSPNGWDKFVPEPFARPKPQNAWNELIWPKEYPLSHHEMSFLLPHFLEEGRGRLSVYFTRVYNPVWTNPDGTLWMDVLRDRKKVGLHIALTPVWSETAWLADYVLPMGVSAERHDLQSQETHAGRWIGFRQPVLRVAREKLGETFQYTYEANPGQVWEEDEFWIELSWRIDPDGALGIRSYFESPYRAGKKVTVEEYYRWIFENRVPGLKEKAAEENLTPMEFMRKYGAFELEKAIYNLHEQPLRPEELDGTEVDHVSGLITRGSDLDSKAAAGVMIDGEALRGFPTPSRKLEFYSKTLADWGWPEYSVPAYIKSHVHWEELNRDAGEFVLIPTFRLPTLIHSRSSNAKWLYEISHSNPVWIHPGDAKLFGIGTGDLIKVTTEIGYFVNRIYVTEGIRPGVVACSHHLGRWRLDAQEGTARWASALVRLEEKDEIEERSFRLRQVEGVRPFPSSDPDTERIWWHDAGVHQNLTFPVHPDPISGMHCWHQKVSLQRADRGDAYGDIYVDKRKSIEVYRRWLAKTRPGPGPGGLRRPLWLLRPLRPDPSAYRL